LLVALRGDYLVVNNFSEGIIDVRKVSGLDQSWIHEFIPKNIGDDEWLFPFWQDKRPAQSSCKHKQKKPGNFSFHSSNLAGKTDIAVGTVTERFVGRGPAAAKGSSWTFCQDSPIWHAHFEHTQY